MAPNKKIDSVQQTLLFSLFTQLSIGLIDWYALTWPIQKEGQLFRTLLSIEFSVQTVEFLFYSVLTFIFFQKREIFEKYAMAIRYVDWCITTPTMILTLMVYMSGAKSLSDYWKQYSHVTMIVILLDWLMLYYGFRNEQIQPVRSIKSACHDFVHFGFYPFFLLFAIIYDTFRDRIQKSSYVRFIFFWFFILWTLYGVAAFFSFNTRNCMYNILDIFSKNVTSLFLVYILYPYKIH